MIKKQLKRRQKEALLKFLILLGVYVFVVILMLGIEIYNREKQMVFQKQIIPAGSLFAGITGLFLYFLGESFYFFREFNLAVSMGQTRKKFVWCYEIVSILEVVVWIILLRGFVAIEEELYHWLLPEAVFLVKGTTIFQWKIIFAVLPLVASVQMLVQALVLRYGIKIYIGIWLLGMLLAYTPQMMKSSLLVQKGIALAKWAEQISKQFGEIIWIGMIFAAVCILGGIAWGFLRKQQVTI